MHFRERLTVPLAYWVLLVLFALSLAAAFGFYLGLGWAVAIGLATIVLIGSLFWAVATVIEVTDTEVRVGRAILEIGYLSGAQDLSAEQAAIRRGPGADARAHLVLRPYVRPAVELTLDDPGDPVPYWLIATRRPRQFAEAVESLLVDRLPE